MRSLLGKTQEAYLREPPNCYRSDRPRRYCHPEGSAQRCTLQFIFKKNRIRLEQHTLTTVEVDGFSFMKRLMIIIFFIIISKKRKKKKKSLVKIFLRKWIRKIFLVNNPLKITISTVLSKPFTKFDVFGCFLTSVSVR